MPWMSRGAPQKSTGTAVFPGKVISCPAISVSQECFALQRTTELLVAAGVVILFVAGLLIAVNNGYFATREPAGGNDVFTEERAVRGDTIAFRYIPVNLSGGTYIVSYEVRGEGPNVTGGWSVAEKKFDGITKSNPIEILVPMVPRTTYTLSIMISDMNQSAIYRATSVIHPDTAGSVLPGVNF